MVYAQSPKQDIALIQSIFGKEKQVLVKDYMSLTEDKEVAFWPLYEAYENERQALVRDRGAKIAEYAQKYGELNDESASKIIGSVLDNDDKLVKLEKKYLGKMTKAIGGLQAAKFFQMETYLRNLTFSKLQEQIPAIDEIDNSK